MTAVATPLTGVLGFWQRYWMTVGDERAPLEV
jgi:hypothetical protein